MLRAVAMLVAGAAGFQQAAMATTSVIMIAGGLVLPLAGDYLDGALTFVYGVRVLKPARSALADALITRPRGT